MRPSHLIRAAQEAPYSKKEYGKFRQSYLTGATEDSETKPVIVPFSLPTNGTCTNPESSSALRHVNATTNRLAYGKVSFRSLYTIASHC